VVREENWATEELRPWEWEECRASCW